jgi:hypothetical protein
VAGFFITWLSVCCWGADQSIDSSLLHRGDEHLGRLREKPRRLEDDFGPGRNAKRLGDGIDAGQRAFHRSHLERVADHFFEFATGILRADRARARTECPASRAAFTVSRPIPLLAPMIKTVATAVNALVGPATHRHVRSRQPHRKMNVGFLWKEGSGVANNQTPTSSR